MKKAVFISCTHHYWERTETVEAVLREQGYESIYITSDFSHYTKQHYKVEDLAHCIQLPTKSYSKNISAGRILSHIRFARDAFVQAEKLQPDLIYAEAPPNSLSRQAGHYKKKHPEVKLILDIFDMWPEGFPNNRTKQFLKLPFAIWGWFRNTGLPKADLVLTECDLFRSKLQSHTKGTPSQTLYLCRADATTQTSIPPAADEAIHLCYLGYINNIIDIPTITQLIDHTQKLRPVVLHIIGDGESRDAFIASVENTGATVKFHGKIYDNEKKQAIFDQCHFGLNIMKESVFIGLTMKSVDYFAGGLPIINSIPADTCELVERYQIGVNINRKDLAETARKITSCDDFQPTMRSNTLSVFHRLFSFEKFSQRLTQALEQNGLIEK